MDFSNVDFNSLDNLRVAMKSNDIAGYVAKEGMDEVNKFFEVIRANLLAAANNKQLPPFSTAIASQSLSPVSGSITVNPHDKQASVNSIAATTSGSVALVSGTGTGKSTDIPFRFAKTTDKLVLSVQPNVIVAGSLYNYLSRSKGKEFVAYYKDASKALPKRDGKLRVVIATSNVIATRLALDVGAFRDFAYFLLDESHVNDAAYYALKAYLNDVGLGVKAYHLTATHNDGDSAYTRAFSVENTELDYTNIDEFLEKIDKKSLISPAKIRGPTVFFVSDEDEIKRVAEFYSSSGVNTVSFSKFETIEKFLYIQNQFNSLGGKTNMLITDDILECGVTVNLSTVIDSGYKRVLSFNPESFCFSYVRRPITLGENGQRMGRTGRTGDGRGFSFKVARVKIDDIEPHLKFYSYLWLNMYGITPIYETYKNIAKFYGNMSPNKARQLLMLKLHPFVSNFFFDEDAVYKNVHDVFSEFAIAGANFSVSNALFAPNFEWNKFDIYDKKTGQNVAVPIPISKDSVFAKAAAYIVLKSTLYERATINDAYKVTEVEFDSYTNEPNYYDEEQLDNTSYMQRNIIRHSSKINSVTKREPSLDSTVGTVTVHRVDHNPVTRKNLIDEDIVGPRSSNESVVVSRYALVTDLSTVAYGVRIVRYEGQKPEAFRRLSGTSLETFLAHYENCILNDEDYNLRQFMADFVSYYNELQERLLAIYGYKLVIAKSKNIGFFDYLKSLFSIGNHVISPINKFRVKRLLAKIERARVTYNDVIYPQKSVYSYIRVHAAKKRD
jgi:hypothetical protein